MSWDNIATTNAPLLLNSWGNEGLRNKIGNANKKKKGKRKGARKGEVDRVESNPASDKGAKEGGGNKGSAMWTMLCQPVNTTKREFERMRVTREINYFEYPKITQLYTSS